MDDHGSSRRIHYHKEIIMNFLQICQEANRLCGLQGTISTVALSTGYQYTLIRFVVQSWIDLQTLRKDWDFLRSSVSFSTVAGTSEYSLATMSLTDCARWIDMIYYTDSSGGVNQLRHISYDQYILDAMSAKSQSKLESYAIDPVDNHLYFNVPDGVYNVTGHYFTEPVELTTATQEPSLPDSYHMLLAYLGGAHMAAFMGNSNVYTDLKFRADQMIGSLMRDSNPAKRINIRGIV